MLIDSFNRVHDYLRISLLDRCNFRCTYCMPHDLPKGSFAHAKRMSAEEIDFISSAFVKLGIKKIRLTGGEPLIRKDVDNILLSLSKYPVELALTTNGALIHNHVEIFKQAGIKSVNVSLDSLDPEKFKAITKRNEFHKVLSNIHLLLHHGFKVKINAVVLANVNENEILNFVQLTRDWPLHIRFIEFMPFDGNDWNQGQVVSHKKIVELIQHHFEVEKMEDAVHDTAKKYKVTGYEGSFAVISTISEPFCGDCNRLRLTSDGKLKNCLFSKEETDILTPLRKGEDIIPLIESCVMAKKAERGGQFGFENNLLQSSSIKNRSMIAIGG